MDRKYEKTFGKIVEAFLLTIGFGCFTGAANAWNAGNYLGALVFGIVGFYIVYLAVNHLKK